MRFKKSPQLPGARRTWAGHHHGSHTPTSTGAILLSKMACQPKHFGRQCKGHVEDQTTFNDSQKNIQVWFRSSNFQNKYYCNSRIKR